MDCRTYFSKQWLNVHWGALSALLKSQGNETVFTNASASKPDQLLIIDWTDLPLFLQAMIEFIWGLVLGIVTTLLVALLLKLAQESFARMRRRSLFNTFPIRTYNEAARGNGCYEVCPVCLEELRMGEKIPVLQCGHIFHRPCLKPWLEKHSQCPLCRLNLYSLKGGSTESSTTSTQLLGRAPRLAPESYGSVGVSRTPASDSTRTNSLPRNDLDIV